MSLLKEAFIRAKLAYYSMAMSQMGAAHRDLPSVLIHTSYLKEQLSHIRSRYAKA